MQRNEIKELHYITHIDNISSILCRGILSHQAVQRLPHKTVHDKKVQARRAERVIPNGLPLHQYANLYFCARNAMLNTITRQRSITAKRPKTEQACLFPEHAITHQRSISREELAILQIAPAVLNLPNVIITEINAAADIEPRWHAVANGLPKLDAGIIYAHSWNHPDPNEKRNLKQHMMAEALVPRQVPPEHITGAYVVSQAVADNLSQSAPTLENVMVLPYMFFQGPRPEHLPYLPAGGATP